MGAVDALGVNAETIVPGLSLVGVVALFARYVLTSMSSDRRESRVTFAEQLAAEQARTAAAETRTAEARERERGTQRDLDAEIALRRTAEAAAADAANRNRILQQMLDLCTEDRRRMGRHLPEADGPILPDPPERATGS